MQQAIIRRVRNLSGGRVMFGVRVTSGLFLTLIGFQSIDAAEARDRSRVYSTRADHWTKTPEGSWDHHTWKQSVFAGHPGYRDFKLPSNAFLHSFDRMEFAAGFTKPSPFLSYLEWRRGLDPPRFDHWHPIVGPALADARSHAMTTAGSCGPVNGLLPLNSYYNYLRWRRSLAPKRFDHYHPNIGPLLAKDAEIRANMPYCPPPAAQTLAGSPSPPPIANEGEPHDPGGSPKSPPLGTPLPQNLSVPEPASIVLLTLGLSYPARLLLRRRLLHSTPI
jgi:hypothetical protein